MTTWLKVEPGGHNMLSDISQTSSSSWYHLCVESKKRKKGKIKNYYKWREVEWLPGAAG